MEVYIQSKHGMKSVNRNRRKAIRVRCRDCTGGSAHAVANCENTECQLYPFRSGTGKQDAKERSKAIRDYCLWCCNEQLLEVSRCHNSDCPLFPYRKYKVDRSAKIKSMPKNDHIGAFPEPKKENEYSATDQQINLVGVGVGAYEKNLRSPGAGPTKISSGRCDGEEKI